MKYVRQGHLNGRDNIGKYHGDCDKGRLTRQTVAERINPQCRRAWLCGTYPVRSHLRR